ncbi:zinc-binding protein A33-like [Betta splendens]|uniref:Zinc-binding protein A33-like n=1 Tax=Betta splendens TaxID=158456 RepID=A0A6P7KP83_BETSP|nr:zinc-binding protein A33-like [Betta splendens]
MDEDMDEPLPLQQDLTCPVCRLIFTDPVLLQCSHSICRVCLQRSSEFHHKCPLCRDVFEEGRAVANRALSSACDTFRQQVSSRQPKQQQPVEGTCNLHLKPLELYCERDEEPVCVDCVTHHNMHRLWPLKEGAPICKRELGHRVQVLEKKVESYTQTTQMLKNAVDHIKYQASQAEKQIKAEFVRLHEILVAEEALRLKALSTEEDQKIAAMNELVERTNKGIVDLKELIDSLKKEMDNEDLAFLQNFQTLKRKAWWKTKEPCLSNDSLLDMGKHVGSLGFKIWKNMQTHVKYYPVVLNPNTASPWLSLSPDLSEVKESPERLTAPNNPERFDPCVFVLGAEGYTSGKHKWDINVGDNPKWVVGVCKESVARKKKFTVSSARGVWAIGLSEGVYTALTSERKQLQVQERPEIIQIKLNFDKGEVSFWNKGSSKHLVTLTHTFDEKMFPIFGPGLHSTPVVLVPGKIAVHT